MSVAVESVCALAGFSRVCVYCVNTRSRSHYVFLLFLIFIFVIAVVVFINIFFVCVRTRA